MFSILDQPQNFFSSCFTEVLLQCCYGVLKLSHNETVSVVVFYLWTAPGTLTSPVYFKQIIIIPAGAKCTASCVADDNSPRKRSSTMLTVLQTSDLLFTEKSHSEATVWLDASEYIKWILNSVCELTCWLEADGPTEEEVWLAECVFDVNQVCSQICYRPQGCQLVIVEVTADSHRIWTVSEQLIMYSAWKDWRCSM